MVHTTLSYPTADFKGIRTGGFGNQLSLDEGTLQLLNPSFCNCIFIMKRPVYGEIESKMIVLMGQLQAYG
jgi:hypothetical protein